MVLACLVRFVNFGDRVTFWTEQARSLIVSSEYLQKPSLLGQEYFRQDSFGHKIFSGALFNYLLVPLILITDGYPIPITSFFALLNIFTGILVYIFSNKIFNKKVATVSSLLFLFNDTMIYHSLFIWNYNFLPIVGLLIFYLSVKNIKKSSFQNYFTIGLLSGFGINLQILFVILVPIIFLFNIRKNLHVIKKLTIFVLGLFLGNLPTVLFDLKHDLYHMRTLWQYFLDTLGGKSDAGISYYYFLPFWPIVAIFTAVLLQKHFKKNKVWIPIMVGIYIILNLFSPKVSFTRPLGMPEGITLDNMQQISEKIADESPEKFNVASTLDFDKRAYVIRYFLRYIYNKSPKDEVSYTGLENLYVLSQKEYNFQSSDVWEITVGGNYKSSMFMDLGLYAVYKLEK